MALNATTYALHTGLTRASFGCGGHILRLSTAAFWWHHHLGCFLERLFEQRRREREKGIGIGAFLLLYFFFSSHMMGGLRWMTFMYMVR